MTRAEEINQMQHLCLNFGFKNFIPMYPEFICDFFTITVYKNKYKIYWANKKELITDAKDYDDLITKLETIIRNIRRYINNAGGIKEVVKLICQHIPPGGILAKEMADLLEIPEYYLSYILSYMAQKRIYSCNAWLRVNMHPATTGEIKKAIWIYINSYQPVPIGILERAKQPFLQGFFS
ncbi:MAG: hypothetical protein M0P71_07595 [Melioribacteraceae bacterium]|jgi:hypothetical protein|nr:hypothetical protein [Melioribacteraceae bacterium]